MAWAGWPPRKGPTSLCWRTHCLPDTLSRPQGHPVLVNTLPARQSLKASRASSFSPYTAAGGSVNMALKLLMKTASKGEVGWLVPASQLVLCGRDRTRFKPLADKLDSTSHNCSGSRAQKPKSTHGPGCYLLEAPPGSQWLSVICSFPWLTDASSWPLPPWPSGFLPWVRICAQVSSPCNDTSHWMRNHSDPGRPCLNLMTSLKDPLSK